MKKKFVFFLFSPLFLYPKEISFLEKGKNACFILQKSYPESIKNCSDEFLILSDDRKILLYDSLLKRDIESMASNPDVLSVFYFPYNQGVKNDAGRVRLYPLLEITYGKTKKEVQKKYIYNNSIIGESEAIKGVQELILKALTTNINVSIFGETGTGKELVAANIHYLSKRRGNKYYKINIASLSENLIESELFGHKKGSFSGAYNDKTGFFILSDNSTLFLDEIGELKLDLQSKLLRAIQEKEVTPIGESESIKFNAGFIFATNKDLLEESKNKRFREDLYYRISTLKINLPPLRERIEDIEEISEKLIENFCIEYNLSIKNLTLNGLKKLKNYYYPGNIRELKNIITRGVILSEKSDKIDENHIIFDNINLTNNNSIFEESNLLSQKKKELEKIYVETQLKKFDYDLEKTASVLGLLINNLYRKMKELEIRE